MSTTEPSQTKIHYSFKNHTCRFSNLAYANCENIATYLESYILNELDTSMNSRNSSNICKRYEDLIHMYLDNQDKFINPNTFINLLEKNFPFLKVVNAHIKHVWLTKNKVEENDSCKYKEIDAYIVKYQIEIYKNSLLVFLNFLSDVRNFHTHVVHNEIKPDNIDLSIFSEINCKLYFKDLLLNIYDAALNQTKNRFNALEENIYHLRRYENKTLKTYESFQYHLFKDSNIIECANKGYAFFINLFAKPDDAVLYLKQLRGFKLGDTQRDRMTVECFSQFCVRTPNEKLDWKKDENSLILDALNELGKLPKEIAQVLDNKSLSQFIETYYENTDESESSEKGNYIRHHSRFEYFAINLLSILLPENDIRFHTYLGKYYEKGYVKKLPDGTSMMRYIVHPAYGFFNNWMTNPSIEEFRKTIQDITPEIEVELMPSGITKYNESAYSTENTFKPHILFAYPHCIINDNKIGISFSKEKKIYPSKNKDNKLTNPKVEYWLSRYELKNLLFYVLLKLKTEDKKIDFKAFFENQFKKDYSKVQREFKPQNFILHQIEYSQKKNKYLFSAHQNSKSYGKKHNFKLRPGDIASDLTRDMVFLRNKPANYKDTITGPIYQNIQKNLGIWNYDVLKRILVATNISQYHPFLNQKVLNSDFNSIYDFAKAYWKAREKYFEKQLKLLHKNKNERLCDYVQKRMEPKATYSTLLSKDLPRGLFKNEIIELCGIPAEEKSNQNETYLILKHYNSNHNIQPYYNTQRGYSFFESLGYQETLTLEQRLEIVNANSYKDTLIKWKELWKNEDLNDEDNRRYSQYRFFTKNEKKIRMRISEDLLLFEAIKQIGPFSMDSFFDEIDLSKIDQITSYKFPKFCIEINDIKIEFNDITPKKYGRLSKVQHNKRINTLCQLLKTYNPTIAAKDIPIEVFNKELEMYNKRVNFVIEILQEFESRVLEKNRENLTIKETGGYYEFNKLLSGISNNKNIVKIRNTFLHCGINFSNPKNQQCPFIALIKNYTIEKDSTDNTINIYSFAETKLLEYLNQPEVLESKTIRAITKEEIIEKLSTK